MSKNIWVINQFGSTPKNNVGSGERFYQFGKYWGSLGHKVSLFAGSYNHHFQEPSPRKFPVAEEPISENFQFNWVWVTKYNPNSGFSRLMNWLTFVFFLFFIPKRKYGKPDIILLTSMSLWPILNVVAMKIRYRKAKFFFEVRDFWPLTPIQMGNMSKNHPVIIVMRRLEKIAFRLCDEFISVLPNADLRLKELVPNKKIPFHWIPNGIDEKLLDKELDGRKEQEQLQLAYSGALGIANCMDVIIQSALKMENDKVEFHIFGDGPLRSHFEKLCQGKAWIHFHGKIPKNELMKRLQKMDVLMISWQDLDLYRYGVSANKYNDYMLAGKPILSASNIAKDPVHENGCGICTAPENVDEYIKGIHHLKSMGSEKRLEMGQKGRAYLLANQTYQVLSKKYSETLGL